MRFTKTRRANKNPNGGNWNISSLRNSFTWIWYVHTHSAFLGGRMRACVRFYENVDVSIEKNLECGNLGYANGL